MKKEFNSVTPGSLKFWNSIAALDFGMESGRYFTNKEKEVNAIANYIIKSMTIKSNDTIVDLACGSGSYHKFLNCNIIGVDFSKKLLCRARIENPNKNYIKCRLEDLSELLKILIKFKPNKIIINNYIHYLSIEKVKILIEFLLSFDFIDCIFIGDIPLKCKKKKLYENKLSINRFVRSIRFFLIKRITNFILFLKCKQVEKNKPVANDHDRLQVESIIKKIKKIEFEWSEQSLDCMFYNSRENLTIRRIGKMKDDK